MSDRLHGYKGKIHRYMQTAKKMAICSEFRDSRHGAVPRPLALPDVPPRREAVEERLCTKSSN